MNRNPPIWCGFTTLASSGTNIASDSSAWSRRKLTKTFPCESAEFSLSFTNVGPCFNLIDLPLTTFRVCFFGAATAAPPPAASASSSEETMTMASPEVLCAFDAAPAPDATRPAADSAARLIMPACMPGPRAAGVLVVIPAKPPPSPLTVLRAAPPANMNPGSTRCCCCCCCCCCSNRRCCCCCWYSCCCR